MTTARVQLDMLARSADLINSSSNSFSFFKTWNKNHFLQTIAGVFYNVNYVNVNYSVKNSTVDCEYLLFFHHFLFRLKPKQFKKCQYSLSVKIIKSKVNIYNQQLNFLLKSWHLHYSRSTKRKLRLTIYCFNFGK